MITSIGIQLGEAGAFASEEGRDWFAHGVNDDGVLEYPVEFREYVTTRNYFDEHE